MHDQEIVMIRNLQNPSERLSNHKSIDLTVLQYPAGPDSFWQKNQDGGESIRQPRLYDLKPTAGDRSIHLALL